MELCFPPFRACLLAACCLLLAACLLVACCLLAKPIRTTPDTKEGYKTKTSSTSSVTLTLTLTLNLGLTMPSFVDVYRHAFVFIDI